jgi:GST-like protein
MMIDFYYWPTPNGWKAAIMLEECGLAYDLKPVNIGKGEQFTPGFLAISPNNRMPAIVDHDVDGDPVPVFESGAILFYLAEKTGRFMSEGPLGRKETLEWLFWQVGNQGPMAGQLSHFVNYAPGEHPYSHQRYANEYDRCLGVLERRLDGRDFILGDYSIADMICWPWVLIAKPLGQSLELDLGKEFRRAAPPSDEERKILFGQTAQSVDELGS